MSTRPKSGSATNAENSHSLGARLATLKNSKSRSGITWGDVQDEALSQMIEACVEQGALISFGRTSDGGAIVLSILDEGEPTRFYAANVEEVTTLVAEVLEVVNSL